MSERYDPYKPAYGPGSNSDNQFAAEWQAIEKEVYGDGNTGGGGGGGGCSGLIFLGIIVVAVLSMVESGIKSFRREGSNRGGSTTLPTPPPAQVHYLAIKRPPFDWSKLVDHFPSKRLTTVTIENNGSGPLQVYSFSGRSMLKHADVPPSSSVNFTCEVDRVLGIGDEEGNLKGVVRAESRPGVVPLW